MVLLGDLKGPAGMPCSEAVGEEDISCLFFPPLKSPSLCFLASCLLLCGKPQPSTLVFPGNSFHLTLLNDSVVVFKPLWKVRVNLPSPVLN